MSKIKRQVSDPDNYAAMAVPYESTDAADEALTKFYEEVSDLRKKYKVTDVLIVTKGSVKFEDGKIGDFMNHSHLGNSLNQLSMSAYAYGQIQAVHEETISKLIAGKL